MKSALADQIAERFRIDQENRPKAINAGDVPWNYEAISTDWLTAVICRDAPGAHVTDFRLDAPDEGTNNRRRIFLTYDAGGQAAGLPASVFCKGSQSLQSRTLLGVSGGTHAETTFYNQVRDLVELNAPRAWFARYDPLSFASMIMLHDMAGSVEFCTERTPISFERAVSQIDLLAMLHAQFYEAADLRGRFDFVTWPDFWSNLTGIGFEASCEDGFRAAEAVIPPTLFRRESEILAAANRSVDAHHGMPWTLNHSDCHLKNWYVVGDEVMGAGDWQVVIGNGMRDLAYCISTSLEIEDRRAWERELLDIYREMMRERCGAVIDADEAWLAYRQQLFSSLGFWTATLAPPSTLPAMQPEATSLKFIERMTHAIDDLDALDSFSRA